MTNDPLVLVPIPALVAILVHHEKQKGAPLTEAEVMAIRDGCTCIALPFSVAAKMNEERGYDDVSPENVWQEWNAIRTQVIS
jgi:hypothetical protein